MTRQWHHDFGWTLHQGPVLHPHTPAVGNLHFTPLHGSLGTVVVETKDWVSKPQRPPMQYSTKVADEEAHGLSLALPAGTTPGNNLASRRDEFSDLLELELEFLEKLRHTHILWTARFCHQHTKHALTFVQEQDPATPAAVARSPRQAIFQRHQ